MASTAPAVPARLVYPPAPRDDSVVDVLHGVEVRDPFRPLEAPDAPETVAWVAAQNALFASYLSGAAGERGVIRAAHEARYSYARQSAPFVKGGRAFVFKNTGLQNQDVLAEHATGRALVDLNKEHPDGTVSMSSYAFSEDGAKLAYALSRGGSDWVTIHVRDVASASDEPHAVPWAKFTSLAWLHDGSGFFYNAYPKPADIADAAGGAAGTETGANDHNMLYFHALGTPAEEDVLVYANPAQPKWMYGAQVTDDGEWLLLTTSKGTDPVNRLYVAHLPSAWPAWRAAAAAAPRPRVPAGGAPPAQPAGYLPFHRLFDTFDGEFSYVANDGPRFYLKTNLGAPRYRIVAADAPAPGTPLPPFVCEGVGGEGGGEGGAPAPAPAPPLGLDEPRGGSARIADVVPEAADGSTLDWACVVAGRHLVTCSLARVAHALAVRLLPAAPPPLPAGATPAGDPAVDALVLAGPPAAVPLPAPGTVGGFSGRREDATAYLKFTSFLHPGTTLELAFQGPGLDAPAMAAGGARESGAVPRAADAPPPPPGAAARVPAPGGGGGADDACAVVTPWWHAAVPGFDADAYSVTQEFVPSLDGGAVQVPLFVVRRRAPAGAPPPPPAPTLLYFYGGFSISLLPSFSALRLTWLGECGGVFALANCRGGGEMGEAWHEGGSGRRKTNTFDDAAACARHLVAAGVTTPGQLGIMGGSNGGLGVLATALRHPGLVGAVVSQVPVTDMLRFHKFTIGHAWQGEYGHVEEDEGDFKNVMAYSPLHNVRAPAPGGPGLPAVLITTADHDDRVVPLHSHKMTATLQAVAGASPHQARPLLTRVDVKAGHGAGKPTAKVLDEYADVYAFLAKELGAKVAGV